MDWKEIDISSDKIENDSFAEIGNGRIMLSIGACKLIKDFVACNYVSFRKAKKNRIYYTGLKFCQFKTDSTYEIHKIKDDKYGAFVVAKDLVNTIYGPEGTSKEYTKHNAIIDEKNPRVLIIYNNYKKQYYFHDENKRKIVRGKHIGTIIDKEWEVISSSAFNENGKRSPTYLVKNINTGEEIYISSRALFDIEKGLSTINGLKLSRSIGVYKYLGKRRAAKKKRIKNLSSL